MFLAQYFDHLHTTFSVHLPWSDFPALNSTDISTGIPTPDNPTDELNITVPISPLCSVGEHSLTISESGGGIISVRSPRSFVIALLSECSSNSSGQVRGHVSPSSCYTSSPGLQMKHSGFLQATRVLKCCRRASLRLASFLLSHCKTGQGQVV